MSDPWIKVYPSDMRADPAIVGMNSSRRYALIQAWDLAKNGPGAIDQLRSSDGSAMTQQELRNLAAVSADETRQLFSDWAARGLCILEDGLVRFPNLAKRQGIDASAAERKRRERERRRHGNVTPKSRQTVTAMSRDVTGESLEPEIEEPSPSPPTVTTRKPDPIWDAFAVTMGPAPETKSGRGGWNHSAKELRDIDADPKRIPVAVAEHRRIWPGIDPTPQSVAKHWTRLTANGNGHTPPELTAEDFDRLEAARDRITAQRRTIATRAGNPDEELPF